MNIISTSVGIRTRYKAYSVNPVTNKETPLSGWSDNVLLTSGRNALASNDWFDACHVGTDNTAPNATQTKLLNYVAGTTTIQSQSNAAQSTAPYYGWKRRRFRFGVGETAANLTEVGIGWSAADGDVLATRSLLVDVNGDETTVTPLADEYLEIVAEIRYYPPLGDSTGTVVFNGVTYNYTLRASNVTSSAWSQSIGDAIQRYSPTNSYWKGYDGNIQDITLAPDGVGYNSDQVPVNVAYSNNSYERKMYWPAGPTGLNVTTGLLLRSMFIWTTAGQYQIQFDSQSNPGFGIPKTADYEMATQFIVGWDEATIP